MGQSSSESVPSVPPLTERAAWAALRAHHDQLASVQLRDLFAADPTRGTRLALEAVGIYLDY